MMHFYARVPQHWQPAESNLSGAPLRRSSPYSIAANSEMQRARYSLSASIARRSGPFWRCAPGQEARAARIHSALSASPLSTTATKSEAWTARRAEAVRAALADQAVDLEAIHRWTRWVEILASGMQPESLATLGYDLRSLEHRSWPASGETWMECPRPLSIPWGEAFLPPALERQIDEFRNRRGLAPAWNCRGEPCRNRDDRRSRSTDPTARPGYSHLPCDWR